MLIGFNWIIENKLAGSGRPGLYREADDDLEFILQRGIDTLVNLTETPLEDKFLGEKKIEVIHFPIPDMGVPLPREASKICTDIKSRLDKGKTVLVHCKAGLGRTGTILACVLVEFGHTSEKAILVVRKHIRMAIQNALQENFIKHYFEYRQSQEESNGSDLGNS